MTEQRILLRKEKPVGRQDPGGIRARYLEKNFPPGKHPMHLTAAPQGLLYQCQIMREDSQREVP